MKSLLKVFFTLFVLLLFKPISAQNKGTLVLNHNFGTSGNIKNSTHLSNNYYWGVRWGTNENNPWSNKGEWQKFTPFTNNNYVFASNHLKIIARFNNDINKNGRPDYAGGSNQEGKNREITSGMLRSRTSYIPTASKSIYVEARIKVPSGKALWPALWLYPKSHPRLKAEIDIFEIVNNKWDSSKSPNWNPLAYHNNLHFNNGGENSFVSKKQSTPLSSAYHVWGCQWTNTQVKFYFDGKLVRTQSYPVNNGNTGWGGANSANVLINLAAGLTNSNGGEGWPGFANDKKAFPATMEVDYLRVYENSGGGGGGGGSTKITSVSAPTSVARGKAVSFSVAYEAAATKKIVCTFQKSASPYTSYASSTKTVNAGKGTVQISMTIPSNVALGSNYQFQTVIGNDGSWGGKDHYLTKKPIKVTNNSTNTGTGYRYLKYTVTGASKYKISELNWLAGSTSHPRTNLTSNTSQSGLVVTGSNRFKTNAYEAFDGVAGDTGPWVGTATPQHITLDFGSNKVAPTKINIQKTSYAELKRFKCEGSNNGSNWTLLLNSAGTGSWTNKTFTLTASRPSLAQTEFDSDKSFVYPNPSKGSFNFNFSSAYKGDMSIKVHSLMGRQVKVLKLQKSETEFTQQIDLTNQSSGVYFIQFTAGEYHSSHQIIKE